MGEPSNPQKIAKRGEQIYHDKYKEIYESKHHGKFVAIDIITEKTYIADSPKEALEKAREDSPKGWFHLIRVGASGAFRVSYTNNALADWLFR